MAVNYIYEEVLLSAQSLAGGVGGKPAQAALFLASDFLRAASAVILLI